jgi:hypothetical protein
MVAQPAGPVGPTSADAPVKFNGKQYQGWRQAREAFRSLKNKSKPHSVWQMLTLVAEAVDDDNSPFALQCSQCERSCQLINPSKWKKEHKCSGPKRPSQATGLGASGIVAGTLLSSLKLSPVLQTDHLKMWSTPAPCRYFSATYSRHKHCLLRM